MKLDQLVYFLEAAKQEHIGKAARALAISPSAISHAIQLLEEDLGRELFRRQGKHIQLTPQGRIFEARARKIVDDLDLLRDELQSDTVEWTGHYRLAASHLLAAKYLAPSWCKLQESHRKLTCELYTLRSSQVLSGVLGGSVDLGICFSPEPNAQLEQTSLISGKIVPVVQRDHPILKLRGAQRIAVLSEYPCVLPKAFQGIEVCERHPVFEKFQLSTAPDCLIDSYEVGLEKVAHSLSWGFFPDWVLRHHDRVRALEVPEDWDAYYSVSAICLKNRALHKPLQGLIEILRTRFEPGFGKTIPLPKSPRPPSPQPYR